MLASRILVLALTTRRAFAALLTRLPELHLLVVHPKFHRRGAGTKLLSWGCDQADEHGVAMCLESTPAGMELYKRFGFREVRTLKADMRQFGWDQPYDEDAAKRVWMVRDTSDRVHKH